MIWIRALDLERWADTQMGRAELADLVGKLISATAPTIRGFRFPRGESSQIPGFDGHLVAQGVPPYIPDGESVWEFGAGRDYLKKANDEYNNRTANPGTVDPANCAFVFVTLRRWDRMEPTLLEWTAEKSQGPWKQVAALDSVALEHWLEKCEPVSKQFASLIRGQPHSDGARSIGEYWAEYSGRFRPKITEEILLCERQKEADDVLRRLISGDPQAIKLYSDSRDEVIAFVAAAIRSSEPNVREFLESRTLILDTRDAASNRLHRSDMIFLTRDVAVELAGSLSYRSPTVIPLAREEKGATGLSRPSFYTFGQALKQIGLHDEEAERLARASGRSVTILARRMPSGAIPNPPWVANRDLIGILFAGGWDAAYGKDSQALAILTGRSYDNLEDFLRPFLLASPEPMDREGSVWKIRAPVDAFEQLGRLISKRDLDLLSQVVTDVFGEINPALDLPAKDRPYAALQGKKMRYSEWLRDGLATSLLLLAVMHEEAGVNVTGVDPQRFVNDLVGSLPGLKDDPRLWMSLERQLPWLMEAAPDPFLSALEHLLEGDGSAILPIFEEHDSIFASSSHTHLLWALESLAWDPSRLSRVTLDMAKLARVDPGGRLANRPIVSLKNILKAWKPETNASFAQRLSAVDMVIAKEAQIGWDLVFSLLPTNHDVGMPSARPRFREAAASSREALTCGVVNDMYRQIVSRSISMARGNSDRVLLLVEQMSSFDQTEMERVCDEIEHLVSTTPGSTRVALWDSLRHTINMHTAYHDARWALPPAIVARLQTLTTQVEPADSILRLKWLFDTHFPILPHATGKDRIDAGEAARVRALRELRAAEGDGRIAELAKIVKFPGLVGTVAANMLDAMSELDELITVAYSLADMPDAFPSAISNIAHIRFGTAWNQMVVDRSRQGFPPKRLAALLFLWKNEPVAWDLAMALGPETVISYWLQRPSFSVGDEPAHQERVAREYLKVGRALAAIEAVGQSASCLPSDVIIELLDGAMKELINSPSPSGADVSCEIGVVFDHLSSRNDVPMAEIAKREYAWLPFLKDRQSSLTLHNLMVQDPIFFVSVICDVFKPRSAERAEASAEEKAKAHRSYELLSSFATVPGFGQKIEPEVLASWVSGARERAAELDRATIADQYIGQVLANAPADPEDHAWPHRVIRDLLEQLEAVEIEHGINMGRNNMQGARMIDPKNPAALERQLSAEARSWAAASARWPRTESLLNSMAADWDHMAENLERRARQDAMRE